MSPRDAERSRASGERRARRRPRIAFFDYADVFEDFYPHYGIDQSAFASRFSETGNHAILTLLQREVGDVVWYVFSLAPELRRARHPEGGFELRFLRSPPLHRALWNAFYGPRCAWRWRAAYPFYAPLAAYASLASWELLQSLLRERPDYLFAQDYATGRFDLLALAAQALAIPLVAYHSGSRPEWHQGRWLKRVTLRHARCLLVSSEEERRGLVRRYRLDPGRLSLFLTPVDTQRYRPSPRAASCAALGFDPAKRRVLFVGRLDDRVKRVSALIEGFAATARAHPDAELVIAGDGPDRAELERRAAAGAARGRVRFLGWVGDPATKVHLYASAECLVLPSRSEGFPSVVGEATACGTPILAARVGGVPEIVVPDESGWLVEPGDDAALRERLAFVLGNPAALAALRPATRRIAEARLSPTAAARLLTRVFAWDGGVPARRVAGSAACS